MTMNAKQFKTYVLWGNLNLFFLGNNHVPWEKGFKLL